MITNLDWLPMGSVIRTEEGERPLMVAGVMVTDDATGRLWDYMGYPYPEVRTDAGDFFFDKSQIVEIFQVGYMNSMACAFQAYLEDKTPEFEKDKSGERHAAGLDEGAN